MPMLSYLLTSTTAEELKAILLQAGLEILSEGGPPEAAEFIGSERGRAQDHLALICLSGSRNESDRIGPGGRGGSQPSP